MKKEETMLSVRGIYENGQIKLLETIPYKKRRINVIVTILEEPAEPETETRSININAFDDLVGIISEREDGSEAHDRYLSETI